MRTVLLRANVRSFRSRAVKNAKLTLGLLIATYFAITAFTAANVHPSGRVEMAIRSLGLAR